jgi:adenylyltransferase/sulfurtransferase
MQANEAIKILSGNAQAINRSLVVIDAWDNRVRQVSLESLRESSDCPACKRGEYSWLEGERASHSAVLCGRNAVQLSPSGRNSISLAALAEKLKGAGRVTQNRYLVRLAVDDYLLTIFADGRAIIGGTDDIATARTVYAKYIGA